MEDAVRRPTKLVVQHDVDPAIGMVLEYVPVGTPGRATGYHGTCTECGRPMHRWLEAKAIEDAKRHIDSHTPQVIGIDPSSVVQ